MRWSIWQNISSRDSHINETVLHCYLPGSELSLCIGRSSFGQVKKSKQLWFFFMIFGCDITTTPIISLLLPLLCSPCGVLSPLVFKIRELQSYPFLHLWEKLSLWYSSLPFFLMRNKEKQAKQLKKLLADHHCSPCLFWMCVGFSGRVGNLGDTNRLIITEKDNSIIISFGVQTVK